MTFDGDQHWKIAGQLTPQVPLPTTQAWLWKVEVQAAPPLVTDQFFRYYTCTVKKSLPGSKRLWDICAAAGTSRADSLNEFSRTQPAQAK